MIIPETITAKINKEMGTKYTEKLIELTNRCNNDYNRGVIHGFLLVLTSRDVLTGDEAMEVLDLFSEAYEN